MLRFIGQRLLSLIPVLLVVAVVVFNLIHLIPGDPASAMLGPEATPTQVAQLRHALGLDRPLPVQFVDWFTRLLRGDLGQSIFLQEPVTRAIFTHLFPTISLTALAEGVGLLVALPAGLLAAWRRDTPYDQLLMAVALLGVAVPSFWLGLNLIGTFAVHWRWFPAAGYTPISAGLWPWLRGLVLPAVSLALIQMGLTSRMLRDATIDVLHEDYIRTARAKGASDVRLLGRHAVRNAMIPTVTVIGTSVATLLGGAVIVETVFAIPGLGQLINDSVSRRDYPVLEGAVLVIAVVYVIVNLVVDILYAWIDPRIRYG